MIGIDWVIENNSRIAKKSRNSNNDIDDSIYEAKKVVLSDTGPSGLFLDLLGLCRWCSSSFPGFYR